MTGTSTLTPVARTDDDIRNWVKNKKMQGLKVGFVPTMGALHDGHLSLVKTALAHCDTVVASIFVNPTQFAPHEDFDSYPRAEDSDLEKLAKAGCALAYCPSANDIYPEGNCTDVYVNGLSSILEGEHRPHFFGGVVNVVLRLFNHVAPDVAVFGEKDYQQLQIIKRMTKDLGLPIKIVGAETMREADGLAMSSRNQYLTKNDRETVSALPKALIKAISEIEAGNSVKSALEDAKSAISKAGLSPIDYVRVCNASTLEDITTDTLEKGVEARILAAAWMGKTRLIDNMAIKRG